MFFTGGQSQGVMRSDNHREEEVTTGKSASKRDPADFIVIEIPSEGELRVKPIGLSAAVPGFSSPSSVWPELPKQVLHSLYIYRRTRPYQFSSFACPCSRDPGSAFPSLPPQPTNQPTSLCVCFYLSFLLVYSYLIFFLYLSFFQFESRGDSLGSRLPTNIDLRFACLADVSLSRSLLLSSPFSSQGSQFSTIQMHHPTLCNSFFFSRNALLFSFYALPCSVFQLSASRYYSKAAKALSFVSEINRPMPLNNIYSVYPWFLVRATLLVLVYSATLIYSLHFSHSFCTFYIPPRER